MLTFAEILAFVEEYVTQIFATSASPGFTWGRSGNTPAGTWLQNDTVPSNKSGRTVFLQNALVKKVFIANEDASILSVDVYYHDGNEVSLTLAGTVTTTAVRTSEFDVSYSIPKGKQLALKLSDTSATAAKNIVTGVLISGNLV